VTPRDYARLHWNWYSDPVLCACAVQVPAALHVWPVLIAKAVHASHHEDNPTGQFTTSAAQLSMVVHASTEVVEQALALLEEGELIVVDRGRLGSINVRLARFDEWQVARGSTAKRKSDSRDRKRASREKTAESHNSVTDGSRQCHPEEIREEEKREEAAASSSTARGAAKLAADSVPPKARSVAGQIQNARRELGGNTAFIVEAMIGRRQQATDRMLSDTQLLNEYWKPLLHLLNEHGPLRLRDALGKAARAQAVHVKYLEPILAEASAAADAAQRPRRKLTDVIAQDRAFWQEQAS